MKVAAVTGPSGSGKTTLIAALIARYAGEGLRVGAIKHTHHPLNTERRGDTHRFAIAGAEPVVLAGASEAVVFERERTFVISYSQPRQLLEVFQTDIVLIEGFRESDHWSAVAITAEERPTPATLAANLDRIWRAR
jgi:molybdopterin-guanine dinucleotide biosynthesis protein MobB